MDARFSFRLIYYSLKKFRTNHLNGGLSARIHRPNAGIVTHVAVMIVDDFKVNF